MNSSERPITHLAWGEITVNFAGQEHQFRDCKIWPGGAVAWNWTETGTHHNPGIQPADIEELLDKGIDEIILTRGWLLRLKVMPETEKLLKDRGIQVHILETRKAVKRFNQLIKENHKVGGVFHTTC